MASEAHWALVGGNGSGKSVFAKRLKEEHEDLNVQIVSFEEEQALLEREIYEDDSEWIDQMDPGRTMRELIEEHLAEGVAVEEFIESLGLQDCIDTGFRLLSTGERRRLMLARALGQKPDVLILDEPYDGVDRGSIRQLQECIDRAAEQTPTLLITHRLSQISERITHVLCIEAWKLVFMGRKSEALSDPAVEQLFAGGATSAALPKALPMEHPYQAEEGKAMVDLRAVTVGYHQKPILKHLDWEIFPGEQWRVSGPNGCGKSTLVSVISGDHPQCYSNELYLFGRRRGTGESIWEVKHHIGIMSTALHQQYRVTVTAETVVLSGFFDTIGVYRPVSAEQREITQQWLEFLKLDHLRMKNFHQLSFGQQRMLLIARALIKRPQLLILDEPCQGLDPVNRAIVIQLMRTIVQRGIAQVIYISHEDEDQVDFLTHELRFEVRNGERSEGDPAYVVNKGNYPSSAL
ncbi:ATP-binding cassette domain-containing protein [Rubritalea marina]|uniref:ATP-binding cassette domain-containing protein n=1 Tax=Rubritalea marina TaxID=361055 RepID=UPI001969F306|nr:ATP-binding cassette domain-containing protein [Rubritalea marina]